MRVWEKVGMSQKERMKEKLNARELWMYWLLPSEIEKKMES